MTAGEELLRRAGWTAGRHVDVEGALRELSESGHFVVVPARAFLARYSGLVVTSEDGRKTIEIDGSAAARHTNPDWCVAYAEGIGRSVTPIGEYSHMTLLIDEVGVFWGGFDDLYGVMGEDILEVVRELLIGPLTRRLDRKVAD